MSVKQDLECINGLVHGLHSTQRDILHKQELIMDKLNGVKHYMPGDCEICMENRASYRVIRKERPYDVLEVCASCAIMITNPPRGRASKWRRESIYQ